MFLVIGASGNVGREVAGQLANAGEPVRVLARSPGRGTFPRDQVHVIGQALGREIGFAELSEEEAWAEWLQRMPRPVVESLLASQRATRDDEPPVYDTVERIMGVPATAYRDWVADHLREFA